MQKWGDKKDHGYVLTEFNAMKKTQNEDVSKFIKRFNKLYKILPVEIKPPQEVTKVFFVGAFERDFGFTLREIKSHTLDQIQTDALEVEANFTSTGKWKSKAKHGDRRRGKEETSSSSHARETQEQNLDEMNKLIRNMSKKLVNLKLERKKSSSTRSTRSQ